MGLVKEEIASRIRQFADKKSLKLKDLADLLGMSPAQLNANYLTGRSVPGPELLLKFHDLGCDIVWLLTGESNESKLHMIREDPSIYSPPTLSEKVLSGVDEMMIDVSLEGRISRLLREIKEKDWSKTDLVKNLNINPIDIDGYLDARISIYNIAQQLHENGFDVIYILTGFKYKSIKMNPKLISNIKQIAREYEVLRNSLSPELVELIFKNVKKRE